MSGNKYLGCDRFFPVSFNGRRCYSLKEEMVGETKQGKENGLLLLIDQGPGAGNQNEDEESASFEIYIHTLSGFSGHHAGSYALDSLKLMTGTPGFINLPDDQKRCQLEDREDCRRRKLIHELKMQCGCVPWATKTSEEGEVSFKVLKSGSIVPAQVNYCNPTQYLCVERVIEKTNIGCRTSCIGLHADVTHSDDSFAKFVTDNLQKQQSNLAEGKS